MDKLFSILGKAPVAAGSTASIFAVLIYALQGVEGASPDMQLAAIVGLGVLAVAVSLIASFRNPDGTKVSEPYKSKPNGTE